MNNEHSAQSQLSLVSQASLLSRVLFGQHIYKYSPDEVREFSSKDKTLPWNIREKTVNVQSKFK